MATGGDVASASSVETDHERMFRWLAVAVIAAGVGVRFGLMRHYDDDAVDLRAIENVTYALTHHFTHAYRGYVSTRGGASPSWTYPAGLFPLLLLDHALVPLGLSLRTLVAASNFLADIGMAALLYRHVAKRRGQVAGLVACALLSFGWPLVFDTGVMNQIDSLGTFFALCAVMLWSSDVRHRTLWACVLLGVATSIKVPFGFLVLAFLPTCQDWRAGARAIGIVAAVPILVTAPFLIADFHNVVRAIDSNHSLPAFAGWSLFVDPSYRHVWLDGQAVAQTHALKTLTVWQPRIVLACVVAVGVVLWYFRVNAVRSAAIIALTIWASNVNPGFTFLVWVIPFVILDEQLWGAALIELSGLIPGVQLFFMNPHPRAGFLFVPLVAVMQAVIVIVLVRSLVRVVRTHPGRRTPSRAQPEPVGGRALAQES
ncbi:MAG TPA: glycosyltransferase family 87 protein [Mycobacteriales bacterium]|nr:glycosyltransferase family 87 protein [Mycobacteriales bacterium]